MNITNELTELGVSLTELAVKGTASIVTKKIKAIKDEKNIEAIRKTYDEIINELILEREQAVRIAQSYKSELDRIIIGDEDIKHLNFTVSKVLDLVKKISPNTSTESFEVVKDLINVDTLKTMQLLGFNYKAAIGEPLTKICAESIMKLGTRNKSNNSKR